MWVEGVQSHRTETERLKVMEVAAATGLVVEQVKVHKLHACNCEVVVMVYNHNSGSLYTTGTPKGLDFLNSQNPAVHWQFSSAVSNACTEFRS
ncbi:hypothetical protein NHX12_022786 [Muraenolepis orangiensis]|uniref:Uncharacterized protein n=1 Tax=Muraenolepis orangiensis TaxID=630683 RepID=A0A9Q0ENW8_9TELE|nr:hypothetical protein NHX12_022786 [Muraenolepis orangiensis]